MPRSAPVRLSLDEARHLALLAQRLEGPRPAPTARGILELVRDIGYLQLDPTNVVARNPQLVLWSRVGRYDPRLLEKLLFESKDLIERPSLIRPTSDLPIAVAGMKRYRSGQTPGSALRVAWMETNATLRRHVLERLRRSGPLPLAAFEDRAIVGWRSTGWTHERNVSQMLEFLWRTGRVVVAGRARGQRLWAPADTWLPMPSPLPPRKLSREATTRAMRTLGIATFRQLRQRYAFGREVTPAALGSLERDATITPVELEGQRPRDSWYAETALLRRLSAADAPERTTLLSPFDNLIIDRERTEQLFGFRYRMEIYLPKHLRVRGFWAMPVLHHGRLVGTVDPRFERERGALVVNAVHLDASSRGRDVRRSLRDAVEDLAGFVDAQKVEWP